MRDSALWTSWYVVLLLFPFMIIILCFAIFSPAVAAATVTEGTPPLGER